MLTRMMFLIMIFLTACTPTPSQQLTPSTLTKQPLSASSNSEAAVMSALPDLGPAREIVGDVWLNTDAPLRLADLSGQVILIEMWTFGCINCRNTIASLRKWHEKYAPEGLVVIGNHYPEFGYERDLDNLRQAVVDLNVSYPVVQDNEGANWQAYKNRYWPTLYLIDRHGRLRYTHIGEGRYEETEAAIQELLNEPRRE